MLKSSSRQCCKLSWEQRKIIKFKFLLFFSDDRKRCNFSSTLHSIIIDMKFPANSIHSSVDESHMDVKWSESSHQDSLWERRRLRKIKFLLPHSIYRCDDAWWLWSSQSQSFFPLRVDNESSDEIVKSPKSSDSWPFIKSLSLHCASSAREQQKRKSCLNLALILITIDGQSRWWDGELRAGRRTKNH